MNETLLEPQSVLSMVISEYEWYFTWTSVSFINGDKWIWMEPYLNLSQFYQWCFVTFNMRSLSWINKLNMKWFTSCRWVVVFIRNWKKSHIVLPFTYSSIEENATNIGISMFLSKQITNTNKVFIKICERLISNLKELEYSLVNSQLTFKTSRISVVNMRDEGVCADIHFYP